MPSNKDTLAASRRQLNKALSTLKKAGLYKPAKAGAPTKYARAVVKKYADVVAKRAAVVSVPSRSIAKEFEQFRSRGRKVVVPIVTGGARPHFVKSKRAIVATRDMEDGSQFATIMKPQSKSSTAEGKFPPLEKGQVYVIPFNRGRRGLTYVTYLDEDELNKALEEYESRYTGMQLYVDVMEKRTARGKRFKRAA